MKDGRWPYWPNVLSFKGKQMRKHRETKKSYYAKLHAKHVCSSRKKIIGNGKLQTLDAEESHATTMSIAGEVTYGESQLKPEQFDKLAHDAILSMLSISKDYYCQFSKS